MRFLTDENIASSVVIALRDAGYSVLDVKEEQWYGMTDQQVLDVVVREKRILITHDRDFLLQHSASAIILRFSHQHPEDIAHRLLTFLRVPRFRRKIRGVVTILLSEQYVEFHS